MYWRGSSNAGIAPFQVRSQAMPCSLGSSTKRTDVSGFTTSTRNGPTLVSMRSPSTPRRAHHAMAPAARDARERVLHREIRVLAEAHHHEQLAGGAVQVEVVAIVEVAIAGADVADRVGDLVNRIVVPRREHEASLFSRRKRAKRARSAAKPSEVNRYRCRRWARATDP
jgi:hypothetical protein